MTEKGISIEEKVSSVCFVIGLLQNHKGTVKSTGAVNLNPPPTPPPPCFWNFLVLYGSKIG